MSTRAQLSIALLLSMAAMLVALTTLYWSFSSSQAKQLAQERNHFLLQSLRKTAKDYLATGMTANKCLPYRTSLITKSQLRAGAGD